MEAAGSRGTEGRAAVARASGGGSEGCEASAVGGTNLSVEQTETVNFESAFVMAVTGLAGGASLYTAALACFAGRLMRAIAAAIS